MTTEEQSDVPSDLSGELHPRPFRHAPSPHGFGGPTAPLIDVSGSSAARPELRRAPAPPHSHSLASRLFAPRLLLGVLAAISQLPAAIYEVAVLALLHGDGVVDVAFQDDGFGNWTSSQGRITPRNPNLPVPPPESGPPLGIFSGKPMPPWTTPLPLEQLLNKSNASGDGNWFACLAGAILADVSGNIRSSMAEPQNSQGSARSDLLDYAQPWLVQRQR